MTYMPQSIVLALLAGGVPMFGGNQEVGLHAEGFHWLTGNTLHTVHTLEVLFGVPARSDLSLFVEGSSFVRTQDCRFASVEEKDWWGLTLSVFGTLRMGQFEAVELRPYFPVGLPAAAKRLLGSRDRWGIVTNDSAMAAVASYNARLADFPQVFGPEGIYYSHFCDGLLVNARYLQEGPEREAAEARAKVLTDEVRDFILGNPDVNFQCYIGWLLARVMGPMGEDSAFTDSASLFRLPNVDSRVFDLLDLFLGRYEQVAGIYNAAIRPDPCMTQLDIKKGEIPFVVQHPDHKGGSHWVKRSLAINSFGIFLDDERIVAEVTPTNRDELFAALSRVYENEFVVIPKAVGFLATILHMATFVNPDECHYEALVKRFINGLWEAGIEYSVAESEYGRWQQVFDGLGALGNQVLVLPEEIAFAVGTETATGTQLHQVLNREDEHKLWDRWEFVLKQCALFDAAGKDMASLAVLANYGYLPLASYGRYISAYTAMDQHGKSLPSRKAEEDGIENAYANVCKDLFWRFLESLTNEGGARKPPRPQFIRNLFFTEQVARHIRRDAEAQGLLDQVMALRSGPGGRKDPGIDPLLEQVLVLAHERQIFPTWAYPSIVEGRLTLKGYLSTFGDAANNPEWAMPMISELEQASGERVKALEAFKLRCSTDAYRNVMREVVDEGRLARAKILKTMGNLKLVDYYMGPCVAWVMGGDALIERIRTQIHVVDHPCAPRLQMVGSVAAK